MNDEVEKKDVIELEEEYKGDVYCVLVPKESNFDEWLDEIERKSIEAGIDIEADEFNLLQLTCPCGHTAKYKTKADVPREDVKCECSSNHWFIKFEETDDVS